MNQNQYLLYGVLTLMAFTAYACVSPSNSDWTKMPDPRSKEFQLMAALSFMLIVVAWPIFLMVMVFEVSRGRK